MAADRVCSRWSSSGRGRRGSGGADDHRLAGGLAAPVACWPPAGLLWKYYVNSTLPRVVDFLQPFLVLIMVLVLPAHHAALPMRGQRSVTVSTATGSALPR
jgi:hypothetical protein